MKQQCSKLSKAVRTSSLNFKLASLLVKYANHTIHSDPYTGNS